jgi:hypothetical protein
VHAQSIQSPGGHLPAEKSARRRVLEGVRVVGAGGRECFRLQRKSWQLRLSLGTAASISSPKKNLQVKAAAFTWRRMIRTRQIKLRLLLLGCGRRRRGSAARRVHRGALSLGLLFSTASRRRRDNRGISLLLFAASGGFTTVVSFSTTLSGPLAGDSTRCSQATQSAAALRINRMFFM